MMVAYSYNIRVYIQNIITIFIEIINACVVGSPLSGIPTTKVPNFFFLNYILL